MNRLEKIKYIVIHCSAGFSLIPEIESFWYKTLKWKSPGYHIMMYTNGEVWYVTKNKTYSKNIEDFYPEIITNGVLGYNSESLHICYIGGVEKLNNKLVAKDTRTNDQKIKMIESIVTCLKLLKSSKNDLSDVKILGHRDFSPDKNGNGAIESWERIKECPSFDAIKEYAWIVYSNENNKAFDLPKLK
jgi:N-acetylmuramoyl-L-alanine amidase